MLWLLLLGTRFSGEALDPEDFGDLEEVFELALVDLDLAAVHEVAEGLDGPERNVFEENDGMLVRCDATQYLIEIPAARRQDQTVTLQLFPFRCQRDVDELFFLKQSREGGLHVGVVAVPTETHFFLGRLRRRWLQGLREYERQVGLAGHLQFGGRKRLALEERFGWTRYLDFRAVLHGSQSLLKRHRVWKRKKRFE